MPDTRDVILEMRGVNKTFKDFWLRPRVKAVQDMNLTVRRGEVIGLLGPNGSGKTTTIKMLLGLLHPTSGQIAVLGKRPSDVKLKERIGYLPEESHPYRFLNAEETLDFYARLFHIPKPERKGRIEALLDMVGLSAARFRPTGEYSKGMQRRVGLAQALINDPDLLILDEPTTGMDPIATRQIKDLILTLKKRGKTIILCTHLLGEVEDVCDRLIIMYGGKIRSEGAVDDLLTVGGRQTIEVDSGEAISVATVNRIEQLLSSEGKHISSVRVPRQRLETLFMDVIERATAAGEATTGAAIGGDVAGFLAVERAEGEALLEQLSAAPEPAPRPKAAEEATPAPAQPDQDVLSEMAQSGPRPVEPVEPAPEPRRDGRPADESTEDESFLSDLTGGRK
jgi:ABC-2 type transport system ATP-binding protein